MRSSLASDPPLGSARTARLLSEIAVRQSADVDRIGRTMLATYADEIPAYAGIEDPSLREDVRAVSTMVVRAWLDVLASGEPPDERSLEGIREGSRRRATQGIDLQSVLRAYRVGIRVMWSELVADPAWREPALQGAVMQVAEWALDFADRVCTEVSAAYLDELTHAARTREHRRSTLLNVILAGPSAEPAHAPPELSGPHLVVVAQVDDDRSLDGLERVGDRLEEQAGALLWTVRHHSVVAAIPTGGGATRAGLLTRLRPLAREEALAGVGLGGLAHGPRETRQSYGEAADALRVGLALDEGSDRVFDYAGLTPLIALSADRYMARRFVAATLDAVGLPVVQRWAAPTLEAYLAHQGRLKESARALGVHPSTLKYRLAELRRACQAVDVRGEQAQALLLALKLGRLIEHLD